MAVYEKSGIMKYKDADGNVYLMLPVTTKDNVDGMEDLDAHLINYNNPHKVAYDQLEDKPFGDIISNTLTWDGNTEGLESCSYNDIYYYRISEAVPTLDDCSNGLTVTLTGAEVDESTLSYEKLLEMNTTYGIICSEVFYFVPSDNYLFIDQVTFPKAGIYVISTSDGMRVTSITIPEYTGFGVTETKTLDTKFLPEHTHSYNDLEDKPFWSETTTAEGTVFSETVAFDSDGLFEGEYPAIILTEGETYTVSWGGVEYECVCKRLEQDNIVLDYIGSDDENNTIPFSIVTIYLDGVLNGNSIRCTDGSTSQEVLITGQVETTVYHPFDVGYLPDSYTSTFDIGVNMPLFELEKVKYYLSKGIEVFDGIGYKILNVSINNPNRLTYAYIASGDGSRLRVGYVTNGSSHSYSDLYHSYLRLTTGVGETNGYYILLKDNGTLCVSTNSYINDKTLVWTGVSLSDAELTELTTLLEEVE